MALVRYLMRPAAHYHLFHQASRTAPETLIVTLDPSGVSNGSHVAEIQISATDLETTILPVTLTISAFGHTFFLSSTTVQKRHKFVDHTRLI